MQDATPDFIIQTMSAYQRTEALRAAIELDVFTAVGRGHADPVSLAETCGASERGVRILCDYLVTLELLNKSGTCYALTPAAERFLDRKAEGYLGDSIRFIASPSLRRGFATLTEAVRSGGTTLEHGGTTAREDDVWVEFARGMASRMESAAVALAELLDQHGQPPRRILDIAAGHGLFGITLAARHDTSELTAQDWPGVLEVAAENAAAAGLASRFRTLPGSAFEVELGSGYDVILLANFLHHFGRETCCGLLRRARSALNPGGRVVALEYVPEEDRVTPPRPAGFALVMLATTPEGDAYTFAEYTEMFRTAGFEYSRLHDLPDSAHRVVIAE